ncbi:hypothetical protein BKA65DRAFT_206367 [Rhexocercosporidium sp. MPI-PUGE-AT-0058]|nr:hypothetical protein BKA65DRAFT_206367 [Rhexocercosporidium sp. MPI-PUGE-AT-0058]
MLWRAVKCHLSCQRTSESQHLELRIKDRVLFHITFFEILEPERGGRKVELWPCGELHSDNQTPTKKPRQVRESALTIFAIPSSELPGSNLRSIFWTMICLRPAQFPLLDYSEKIDDLVRGNTHEMIDEMSGLVYKALLAVVSRWEKIAEYFDGILSERKGLFNPEYHDSLLTDDGIFSRSKKYFWAIGFLEEVGNSISDNIVQLKRFVELMKSNPPTLETTGRDFQLAIEKHYITIQRMQMLKTRFLHKKKEAMALRDGLFSASAVMESRASTQLGENIRLLTFSFWSINDNLFSLSALAIVIPIVSICTYAIVFNLNGIAWLLKQTTRSSLLQKFIDFQIDGMGKGTDSHWRDRGASLSKLRAAHQGKGHPSRWRFLHFAARQVFLKKWAFIPSLQILSRASRSGRAFGASEGDASPVSLGNLGDIHVRVEVDVESCNNSQKET